MKLSPYLVIKPLGCLSWFNRTKITLWLGYLLLILGSIFPWYSLHKQALGTFNTNFLLANVIRGLISLLVAVCLVLIFGYSINRVSRLPFWGGLIIVLLFPYFITTWSPTVTFLATAYYAQGERVSDHVETNFSEVQAQWEQNISLPKSRPVASIFELSIQDSRFFQMSSWDRVLLEGFGYRNSFFAFIGKGWSFTVVGLVISLMGFYLGLEDGKLNAFLRDMSRFLPGVGLLLGLIVFSIIWSNLVNHRLDTLFAKGEYHQVVAASQTLASWYPPLRGDAAFLERMGKAGFYVNEANPALINFVKGLECYRVGDFLKSEEYFQRSLDIQPNQFLVRGYLAAAFLNEGVGYFNNPTLSNSVNNHRPGGAVDRFEKALQTFPGHVEALYNLMISRSVNGEFENSAEAAQRIIEGQQYFQQPTTALLGQAYLHLTWNDYDKSNVTKAWKRYRQSIDPNTWKKSVEKQP